MAFPLYQIAYRDQGGVDFYTSHLALLCESVQILEVGDSLNSESLMGLKSLKLRDLRRWGFETDFSVS